MAKRADDGEWSDPTEVIDTRNVGNTDWPYEPHEGFKTKSRIFKWPRAKHTWTGREEWEGPKHVQKSPSEVFNITISIMGLAIFALGGWFVSTGVGMITFGAALIILSMWPGGF